MRLDKLANSLEQDVERSGDAETEVLDHRPDNVSSLGEKTYFYVRDIHRREEKITGVCIYCLPIVPWSIYVQDGVI